MIYLTLLMVLSVYLGYVGVTDTGHTEIYNNNSHGVIMKCCGRRSIIYNHTLRRVTGFIWLVMIAGMVM